MQIRFYIDPVTGRPHVEGHGVSTSEAVETLDRAREDFAGYDGARIAIGPTVAGRVLKVVYKDDRERLEIFVITAYPISGNELRSYRRRLKRKDK